MYKKLSKKARNEAVTKGYLHDLLDYKLKDYVTNDYLENVFAPKFRKDLLVEIDGLFVRHVKVLVEDNHDTVKTLIEAFENRFETIERRLNVIN